MKPPTLSAIVLALAATIPDYAGKSFSPAQNFWQESSGDILIIGADGRKIRFVPDQVKQILEAHVETQHTASAETPVPVDHLSPGDVPPPAKYIAKSHEKGKAR